MYVEKRKKEKYSRKVYKTQIEKMIVRKKNNKDERKLVKMKIPKTRTKRISPFRIVRIV